MTTYTKSDVDRLYETWRALALSIETWPKGSRSRNTAVISADNAWKAYEEADDQVNGKPVGWHRQTAKREG